MKGVVTARNDPFAALIDGMANAGYAIVEEFLPRPAIDALRAIALDHDVAGRLAPAGTGHGEGHTLRAAIRGDSTRWLDYVPALSAERAFVATIERLRVALNRTLALGVHDYEGHYAMYPPGARYALHRDRFGDDGAGSGRIVSCVLYLNGGWREGDGGQLRLHLDAGTSVDVLPRGGSFVAFLSARFAHEVLPATRPRWAIAGWLRRGAIP